MTREAPPHDSLTTATPLRRGVRHAGFIPRQSRRASPWVAILLVAVSALAADRPDWGRLLRQPDAWFRSPEARQATTNILSFQTAQGDWPKNTDTVSAPFTGDRTALRGTFDNSATVNEIRFLARAHRATADPALANAIRHGVEHILAAQYANGGWPQSAPPGSGYARHITFNDGTQVNLMELTRAVARDDDFAFLGTAVRSRANDAFQRGIACILKCQVRVDGRLTIWGAQHDEQTFEPRPARTFEPVSLSAGESVGILRLLMGLPEPSLEVGDAIRAGAAWYETARLTGIRQVQRDGDKEIVPDADAPPLWARFYELGGNRPIFAGRDGVVKYRLADIERERRTGYAWYGEWGAGVAKSFARWSAAHPTPAPADDRPRLRVMIETDAGGDPDDEQSLVRFLLYANEWDVAGVIANRPQARDGENRNSARTGLAIVRRLVAAYGECHPNLVRHDARYPTRERLAAVTVAGTNATDDAVNLILAAVDSSDPRPLWYGDWGSDRGAATNNLHRALDRVLRERGPDGYARFKARLRLSSYDNFGDHTTRIAPPFPFWVDTFRPELDRRRWYHRFSALTSTAGGFDVERDARTGHGPLGALYPTNTTHWCKEGDSMAFIYLLPTGLNDPRQPTWGSWAGRYGPNPDHPGLPYFWANQRDAWHGTTNRDNTLARWAVALQNDFRARLDWCVATNFSQANHPPHAVLNDDRTRDILYLTARPGETVQLSAAGSSDPDGDTFTARWYAYPEAGTYAGTVALDDLEDGRTAFTAPPTEVAATLHVILELKDHGSPPLFAFRRAVVTVRPAAAGPADRETSAEAPSASRSR